jgi:hypothetical protein
MSDDPKYDGNYMFGFIEEPELTINADDNIIETPVVNLEEYMVTQFDEGWGGLSDRVIEAVQEHDLSLDEAILIWDIGLGSFLTYQEDVND